jgi:hypothetical protein
LNTSSGQAALGGLEKKLTGNVPDDSDVPGSVRRSVRLMLAGGALTALIGVFYAIAIIADKNALTDNSGKKLTSSEITGSVVYTLVVYLLEVAIWVLMARMNRAGRGWARVVASILAVISTYYALQIVNGLRGGQTITVMEIVFIVVTLATWIVGAVAAMLLWRSESSAYFRERARAR